MEVERAFVVAVDIGGSGVRAARAQGERLGPVVAVPLPDRGVEAVLDAVAAAAREAASGAPPIACGVGVPGFVRGGRVLASPNLPAFRDEPLAERLTERLGAPVRVENDANLAALGAYAAAGGRGDLVLLTLGTGVGGGIVIDGRLLVGAGGTGAEVGHIFAGGEEPCGCGGRGCLETWCSSTGLARRAAARGIAAADGEALVRLADAGDEGARALLAEAGRALGRGLVTLVNLLNPDRVVIAGGLAGARPHLAPPAEAHLRAHGIAPCVERVTIEWAGRAEAFALVGAARVAWEMAGAAAS